MGPRAGLDEVVKNSQPLPGIDPLIIQPTAILELRLRYLIIFLSLTLNFIEAI
jgi:hypothetical protein